MSRNDRQSTYFGYYEAGNTAKKIRYSYTDYEYEFEEDTRSVKSADKRQLRAQGLSRTYGFFLVFMAMVLLVGCIIYLDLRNDITAQQKTITGMESELSALRLKNDEELDRIEGAVDMEKIKKIAMEELGMTYPDSGQVVDIEGGAGDYVRQYKDIPEKKEKR